MAWDPGWDRGLGICMASLFQLLAQKVTQQVRSCLRISSKATWCLREAHATTGAMLSINSNCMSAGGSVHLLMLTSVSYTGRSEHMIGSLQRVRFIKESQQARLPW